MVEIEKEIESIIGMFRLSLEDKEISEENLRDDIKSMLEEKVVDLIIEEVLGWNE